MLWEAVPTALAAALSPPTLLIVAGLLSLERPMRNASVFMVTAAVVTVGVGFALVQILKSTGIDDSHKHRTVPPALDLALGVVILVFAAFVARRPPHETKEKAEQREMRLLVIVGLGLFVGSPSALYVTSLHSIAKGNPSGATVVLDVLLIAAIVLLMAEIPIALYAIAPDRTAAALKATNEWLARHGRVIVLAAAVVVGCYFVISGIVHLV
jgi:hypothetical protein